MKTIQSILEDNNFELNDANEAEMTLDFGNEQEAYDFLEKVNKLSPVRFSVTTSDPSYDVDEDGEEISDSSWVVADYFFSIKGLSIEDIEVALLSIKSL